MLIENTKSNILDLYFNGFLKSFLNKYFLISFFEFLIPYEEISIPVIFISGKIFLISYNKKPFPQPISRILDLLSNL